MSGPDLFMEDWLSRQNHDENKDAKIISMQFNINAIQTTTYIPECMTMHEMQQAMSQDQHLEHLKDFIIKGWSENRVQITQDIRTYWIFRDDMEVNDRVIIKGRCIVLPEALQKQALQQLHRH